MTNGSNDWDVSYSRITWLEKFLRAHDNIDILSRTHDILFTVQRRRQGDILRILCCDEYTMGITKIMRGLSEFGDINIFYIGGGWCGYTPEAKKYCLEQSIGVFVTDEMTGALWRNEYWTYHRKDEDGNPRFFYQEAG